jgi:Txe/YoeB family toxin of Txe-Axe toxin-antitoxin module
MSSSFWKNRKLLVSITTYKMDPFELIKQAEELKIDELAVFLTGFNSKEREELYKGFEKSTIKSIPFIHLRTDMGPNEIKYLIEQFGAKAFNIHGARERKLEYDISEYKDKIFIENLYDRIDEEEIKNYAGICFDVNHLEELKYFNKSDYEFNFEIINKYPIGCNHLSPMRMEVERKGLGELVDPYFYNNFAHVVSDLSQFDYLKNYKEKLFGQYLALEVRNNLYEQVKMKDYIQKLLEK